MNLGPASWGRRERPLSPIAAVGLGSVATALGRALLEREGSWRASAGDDVLLVVGDAVPWIDGLIWLGRDPRAPGLLLPTGFEPPVHPQLIAAQLGPVALILSPPMRLALGGLGKLDPATLAAWLEGR